MYQIHSAFSLDGFLETRIGGRSENQDACGFSDSPLGALAVVCDGMGGVNGGSTASSIAVQTLIDVITSADISADPETVIRHAVSSANTAIILAGRENQELEGMGTTMVLLLINHDIAYVASIGDSRVYQIRAGKKVFRTFDDSVVFQLVKSGAITEEEARVAGNSNVITKALGIQDEVECEVKVLPFDKNDRFLLCTDGFWGPLPENRLIELIGKKGDLSLVFERAFNKVECAGKENHPNHYDNLTAAIIDVKQYSKIRSKMEKRFKLSTICLSFLLMLSLVLLGIVYSRGNKIEQASKAYSVAVNSKHLADSLEKVSEEQAKVAEKTRAEADRAHKEVLMNDGKGSNNKELSKKAKDLERVASKAEHSLKKTKKKADIAASKAKRARFDALKAKESANGVISSFNRWQEQINESDLFNDSINNQ